MTSPRYIWTAGLAALALTGGAAALEADDASAIPYYRSIRCGSVYTKGSYGWRQWMKASKEGHVSCRTARRIIKGIYAQRVGRVRYHCTGGGTNCSHADSYSTMSRWPRWRFWTGAGGGSAWIARGEADPLGTVPGSVTRVTWNYR